MEIETQVCSDCGTPAEYDPDQEALQKQLDNDPVYQQHLAQQEKKKRKSYWTQMVVYIVGAIIIAFIGSTSINPDLSMKIWLVIGFGITVLVYHLLKYLIDISP